MRNNVTGVFNVFSPDHVEIAGVDVAIAPEQTLAVSMALHELATIGADYGAISCLDWRVSVTWYVCENMLHVSWEEERTCSYLTC